MIFWIFEMFARNLDPFLIHLSFIMYNGFVIGYAHITYTMDSAFLWRYTMKRDQEGIQLDEI